MKRANGNFGKYFCYKLGKSKPSIVIFAILNFLSTIMPCIILSSNYNNVKIEIESSRDNFYIIQEYSPLAFYLMIISAVISMIMITRTTVKSLKIYHSRAAMDTLGCLPLSYGERFWGDLLSSVCANFISLVPFSIISLIIIKSVKYVMREISQIGPSYFVEADIPGMFLNLIFILMFVYIGIYAVTTFVSSCCGKFGSSVSFSLVAMAVPPGIFTAYANYFFSFVTGADPFKEIASNVGMMPPFGMIFSIVIRFIDPNIDVASKSDLSYITKQPRCLIVSMLITAAFIVGAYFIGKKRKAEKTGEEFIFRSVHYILSLTLVVMIIGVASLYFFGKNNVTEVIFVLLISFFIHIILELSQNKNLKGFWKIALRFAAVFGACFAFLTVVRTTNAFDFYKKLPSENSIKEVRVSGMYFFTGMNSENSERIYKTREAVSGILSEHKKLLTADGLSTGNELEITYVTKGGEFTRRYIIKNDSEPIKNFSNAIKNLEEFDPSIYGILNNSDFSGIEAVFDRYNSEENMLPYGAVRSDKLNELAELLKYDLENNYFDDSVTGRDTLGILYFNDEQHSNNLDYYRILTTYKDTLEFLNDPGNYVSAGEETTAIYYIRYNTNKPESGALSYILISVSEDDTSEYVKELLSYIEEKDTVGEYSADIRILDNYRVEKYGIKAENEKAAVKALLNLFREKYAH